MTNLIEIFFIGLFFFTMYCSWRILVLGQPIIASKDKKEERYR